MEGKFYTRWPRKASMVRDLKGKEEPAEGKFSGRRKQLEQRSWGRCVLTYQRTSKNLVKRRR